VTPLEAFHAAVRACDPTARVAARAPRAEVGIAVGKSALAMARGATVERGIIVAPLDGHVPGWTTIVSAHPFPDERSIQAAHAVRALIESAEHSVLALISGGASSLIEDPTVPLDEYIARVRVAMHAGASIYELNALRTSLSKVKGGKLIANIRAHVTTLVASDVFGDALEVVGSGPTIGGDTHLVIGMRAFAEAMRDALGLPLALQPYTGHVDEVAAALHAPCIAWGEPVLDIPADHGEGGRAQQLALLLAKRRVNALVLGTDGIDGPPPAHRPPPAGAIVDATTWDRIRAAGIDPDRALARRDAGTALAAVGALVITGPTGVNHADVCVLT
jgi:hydroxypyruvate reductase